MKNQAELLRNSDKDNLKPERSNGGEKNTIMFENFQIMR